MTKEFKYSALQYCYSQISGECINVGLLFLFEYDNEIRFVFPENIHHRLDALYPNVNTNIIEKYLKSYAQTIKELSQKNELTINEEFIHTTFIKDSTNLNFGDFKAGSYNNLDKEKIIAYYEKEYFWMYKAQSKTKSVA